MCVCRRQRKCVETNFVRYAPICLMSYLIDNVCNTKHVKDLPSHISNLPLLRYLHTNKHTNPIMHHSRRNDLMQDH